MKYGGLRRDLDSEKWNVVVASIEGLFSGISNSFAEDIVILNIICDGRGFVSREGRNTEYEEKFNKSALYPFVDFETHEFIINSDNDYKYYEISLKNLQNFSDDDLLKFMDELCQ